MGETIMKVCLKTAKESTAIQWTTENLLDVINFAGKVDVVASEITGGTVTLIVYDYEKKSTSVPTNGWIVKDFLGRLSVYTNTDFVEKFDIIEEEVESEVQEETTAD